MAGPQGQRRSILPLRLTRRVLAVSPEERVSHLKRTPERMPEWPQQIGTDPARALP